MTQKIVPCLWFDHQAKEAAEFYCSIFPNSKTGAVLNYNKDSAKASGQTEGSILTVEFSLNGQQFVALNGGPAFPSTAAISLFVHRETKEEVDELFQKLSAGGTIMMPLDKYDFSQRYAFFKDKYGVAWQVMLSPGKHHIAPCLLFVGEKFGKADNAVKLYTSVFKHTKIERVLYYEETKNVLHASFYLEGQEFMAMDGPGEHNFDFNESISFLVNCKDQKEVDYYWEHLTADGGQDAPCSWLKDKFGVSWQIAPTMLLKLHHDPDRAKADRVMKAMLRMHKIIIADIEKAARG